MDIEIKNNSWEAAWRNKRADSSSRSKVLSRDGCPTRNRRKQQMIQARSKHMESDKAEVGVVYLWVCAVGVSVIIFCITFVFSILQYCNYQGTYANINNIGSSA